MHFEIHHECFRSDLGSTNFSSKKAVLGFKIFEEVAVVAAVAVVVVVWS